MKKIILYSFLLLVIACGKDSGSAMITSNNGQGGSMARFAVVGDYLYAVDRTSLHAISLSDNALDKVGITDLGMGVETIFPFQNQLFIGSETGVFLFDVSNPTRPVKQDEVEHVYSCDPVVTDGTYAYATLRNNTTCRWNQGSSELLILNVSDPGNASIVGTLGLFEPYGLGLDSEYLFVCDEGVKMYDRSTPSSPYLITSITGFQAYDVIVIEGDKRLLVSADDGIYQFSYAQENFDELSKISIQ